MGNCAGIMGMCQGEDESVRVHKDKMQDALAINREQELAGLKAVN